MKKLTIVGDERVLRIIEKQNVILLTEFNLISYIEDVTEKENVVDFTDEEKEDLSFAAKEYRDFIMKS